MSSDLALGCITLIVAVVYYFAAAALPQSQLDDTIGPGGLPKSYAIVLAGLSLILIAQSLRKSAPSGDGLADATHWRKRGGMLLMGIAYIVAAPWLGYIVSIAILILATTYYQGGGLTSRVAVVAVSGALLFWALFVLVLGIPQPPGFWPSLF